MATESTSTPNNGTGGHTVHEAANLFASFMSDDDKAAGTHDGSEAKPHESEEEESGEEQVASEGSEHEEEEGSESETEVEEDDGKTEELPDDAKVVIEGKEVTLHELKRGFLREQDYTRKTQALADERREFHTVVQKVHEETQVERTQLAQQLANVQSFMQELMPQEPNWSELIARDPQEYAVQRELWRSWHEQLQGLEGRRRAVQERMQQQTQSQFQSYLQTEKAKLTEALPDWSKPEVAKADKGKMLATAKKHGYSEDEVMSVVDHRALVILRKAALYDEIMDKKQQTRPVAPKGPKTLPPGTGKPAGKATDLTRSKQRLAQTGKVRDAASAIYHMLDD